MVDYSIEKQELDENGFTIVNDVFSEEEISTMLSVLSELDTSKPTFRKTNDLFAIRQFLKEIPAFKNLLFNVRLKNLIQSFMGGNYFVIKSIYFDKPEQSNWFVAYHQDLTISVDKKAAIQGYGPWTVKQAQFAVQPPLDILQSIYTLRIHLDDTDEENGALKVIKGSHQKNIYRPETIDWKNETEVFCRVKSGGVMIMRPLLLHASNKTTNQKKRRVLHIEFSDSALPDGLNWAEKIN